MATKTSPIKVLFFSPYFHPYVSGLTLYPLRLFTESGLPLKTTCLTFKHSVDLLAVEKMSLRTPESGVKQSAFFSRLPRRPPDWRTPRNDIYLTIHRMSYWFQISKGFISPLSLIPFWNEAKKNQLVFLNLPSIEGIFLALFAKIQRKPLISVLHCEVLLPSSLFNWGINFILNCGVFIQLVLSDSILVYTKDYFEKKYLYSFFKNKMKVILPPIHFEHPDKEFLFALKSKTQPFTHVVGFCGRIAAEKGIEVLIAAVAEMKDTLLLFAGPTGKEVIGEDGYFQKIQQLLVEKKIPHQFLGTLSGTKLSAFYKALSVLVLPSLNKTEAFGMVQGEAMLQGTPVIASNLPGVRVPIHITKMGKVVEVGNVDSLNKAILSICANKGTYSNPQLIHKAKSLFDPQKTYVSIYSVMKKLI